MIKMRLLLLLHFFILCLALPTQVQGQADTLFESSVSELLKLPPRFQSGAYVESASKQAESIFEAPVSVSVITREEIQNAGCLSIPEALRLMPGVLVREVSNGTYHINIRGYNDLPPGSDFYGKESTNALVLIDYRPIFNYYSGGVFWESLPISIQDIERIELVRGPAAALYGANAVTGVIHIITRRAQREGAISYGNVELGNHNTFRLNTAAGYAWDSKSQFVISGNITRRYRFTTELYDILEQRYTSRPEDILSWQTGDTLDYNTSYPRPEKGIERYGINGYFQWKPKSDLMLDFTLGYENSYATRPYPENFFTPHSTLRSETWYVNSLNKYKEGILQVAYLRGTQEPGVNVSGSRFHMEVLDINAEYHFDWGLFQIKPGLSYRDAVADDRDYEISDDSTVASGLLNGIRHINNIAGSLRGDLNWKNLRLVAALRLDHFSVPKDDYLSFQLGGNYQVNKKHLLRVVYSKSNRGSSMLDVFSSFRGAIELDTPFPGAASIGLGLGGRDNKLLVSRNLELGYRFQPNEKIFLDLEVYRSVAQGFGAGIFEVNMDTGFYQGQPRIFVLPTVRQTDLELVAIQRGLTFSLNYTPSRQVHLRAFGSLQSTRLNNFSPFYVAPTVNESQNYLTQEDIADFKGAPRFFGGFYLQYGLGKFWQFNVNGYYFSSHRISHFSDPLLGREINYAEIEGKLLLNVVVAFRPFKGLKLFGNLRNLLGMNTYEYYFTDRVGRTFTGGITYGF